MSQEVEKPSISGWVMVPVNFLMYVASIAGFIWAGNYLDDGGAPVIGVGTLIAMILLLIVSILVSVGFLILQPNAAAVLILFGKYNGTVRTNGFWWVNPFNLKKKISLRSHNMNVQRLKVNDSSGNPIEIAAVVVWKVEDTYSASFEVENYLEYVEIQSESALRHLASSYPYDSWEEEDVEGVISLRGSIDEVSQALQVELQERLSKAGVRVEEARLSHLAYASEVAEAMLKRQQASAIVAARRKIVDGAVGMVVMALEMLKEQNVVELDEERKAAMVSNLLVVLCGEKEASPVINTGTLYN